MVMKSRYFTAIIILGRIIVSVNVSPVRKEVRVISLSHPQPKRRIQEQINVLHEQENLRLHMKVCITLYNNNKDADDINRLYSNNNKPPNKAYCKPVGRRRQG